MAEVLEVRGGVQLNGEVKVSGAKNAVLPMLIAALLTSEECEFDNVPNLEDVNITSQLLRDFGAKVQRQGSKMKIKAERLLATEASYALVKAMRASFWILAPLLARGGAARVALPGGDIIGARPVDLHISALTAMGAEIQVKHGVVYATAPNGLHPAEINFRFPSVGATHQILMAASLTPGITTIKGAAREPEVIALCEMLTKMGAKVEGIGSSELTVHGQQELSGCSVKLIGDRIEAASYVLACAAAGGEIKVSGINPDFFGAFKDIIEAMGLSPVYGEDYVIVKSDRNLKAVSVKTAPFPGLATDIQALLMAALCSINGNSEIEETIFEGRFGHVSELSRMGAKIEVEQQKARVLGGSQLSGADVEALDIRAAAALAIAGLAAEGVTRIHETHHLRRGYQDFDLKLQSLGANVLFRQEDMEDFLLVGC